MQTIGTLAATFAGTVYHQANRTQHTQRSRSKKTDYGTIGCCNSFLKTTFTPIAPVCVTGSLYEDEYNYITSDNYEYLVKSAQRYAALLGVELVHNPGKSIGEGISNIYDALDAIIGEINLNIEPREDKLEFVLWKYHPWGDYTFYWLPVKFTESLNPKLKKIAWSFIHRLMYSNGMITTNEAFDTEWILEWAKEGIEECDPQERKQNQRLIASYESGKVYQLMDRIKKKCYYKDLPKALRRYVPQGEFEKELVGLFEEGLQFIGEDKPSIMSYGYDPHFDQEGDYHPVDMERMIRVIYDTEDFISKWMMDWTNDELREAYDISPVTQLTLAPDTEHLFSMNRYPDLFFNWFDKMCTLIS